LLSRIHVKIAEKRLIQAEPVLDACPKKTADMERGKCYNER